MNARFIQFMPWMDCNNNCNFCYGYGYHKTTIMQKIINLKKVKNELFKIFKCQSNTYKIGLTGGEFFDGQVEDPDVKREFYDIIEMIAMAKRRRTVERFLINTSLIVNNRDSLIEFIKFIESVDLLDILVICTSYDIKYRFKTALDEQRWKSLVKWLNTKLVLPLHVEMIVSQFFIDACMDKSFDIAKFKKDITENIDYIEPMINSCQTFDQIHAKIPDFFVRRKSFLDFVKKICIQERCIDINTFLSINLHSNSVFGYYPNENRWILSENRHSTGMKVLNNGQIKQIKSYVDSDMLMTNDVQMLREAYL